MGLTRGTVRGYAHAQHFPEWAVQASGLGILAQHREYFEAHLAEGNENATALWRELQDRGFSGSATGPFRAPAIGMAAGANAAQP